ncbi:hypothetical protein ACMYYO_11595 [Dermacoccaceae bacterium W4C1]
MAFTCDQCGKRTSGKAVKTVIGRDVCAACDRRTQALAAGAIAGNISGTGPVPTAIATAGWRERIHKAVRGRRQ